jgi:hypothetical protein
VPSSFQHQSEAEWENHKSFDKEHNFLGDRPAATQHYALVNAIVESLVFADSRYSTQFTTGFRLAILDFTSSNHTIRSRQHVLRNPNDFGFSILDWNSNSIQKIGSKISYSWIRLPNRKSAI